MKKRTHEDRILRLEVLAGLASAPESWGITPKRVKLIRDHNHCDLRTARKQLIRDFGETQPEEKLLINIFKSEGLLNDDPAAHCTCGAHSFDGCCSCRPEKKDADE